jgi:hypothetical protein
LWDQCLAAPFQEASPEFTSDQNHRSWQHFSGLYQGDDFEALVEGPESAGQDHKSLTVAAEEDFPDEKITASQTAREVRIGSLLALNGDVDSNRPAS